MDSEGAAEPFVDLPTRTAPAARRGPGPARREGGEPGPGRAPAVHRPPHAAVRALHLVARRRPRRRPDPLPVPRLERGRRRSGGRRRASRWRRSVSATVRCRSCWSGTPWAAVPRCGPPGTPPSAVSSRSRPGCPTPTRWSSWRVVTSSCSTGRATSPRSPRASTRFVARAAPVARRTAFVLVPWSGHGMLLRAGLWHHLTAEFVARDRRRRAVHRRARGCPRRAVHRPHAGRDRVSDRATPRDVERRSGFLPLPPTRGV